MRFNLVKCNGKRYLAVYRDSLDCLAIDEFQELYGFMMA